MENNTERTKYICFHYTMIYQDFVYSFYYPIFSRFYTLVYNLFFSDGIEKKKKKNVSLHVNQNQFVS